MRINWRVRFANRDFWLEAIPAALLLAQALLECFGAAPDFGALGQRLQALVSAVFALLAVLGVVNDPTTQGPGDSQRALTYREPWRDGV